MRAMVFLEGILSEAKIYGVLERTGEGLKNCTSDSVFNGGVEERRVLIDCRR